MWKVMAEYKDGTSKEQIVDTEAEALALKNQWWAEPEAKFAGYERADLQDAK